MYRIRSALLLAALAGLFALVTQALFGWIVAALVLVVALALNGVALDRACWLILRLHRARALSPWEAPGLHGVVRELSSRAGLPVPALMVYPADMPNAFALGGGPGVVALSTGLLQLLDLRQITGVAAHELAHLKNRDSAFSIIAGLFVQVTVAAAQLFGLLLLLLFLSGQALSLEAWPLLVLLNLASPAAMLLQAGLLRTRERLADRDAALLTGDPRGLASALHRLHHYSRYLTGLLRRFRFIYTSGDETGSAWLCTHPSTGERVAALLALERESASADGSGRGLRAAV